MKVTVKATFDEVNSDWLLTGIFTVEDISVDDADSFVDAVKALGATEVEVTLTSE